MDRSLSVSVGIPFLNAQRTLADAVRSVLAQTHQDWELLLVNDGSSDGSLELASSIADPRVRVISDGERRGLCVRLNQIAALARGKYLARMDADDLMHPRRLECQLKFLESNPQVDLVDTATYTIDEDCRPLGIRGDKPLNPNPKAILKRSLLLHPTVTGRTQWFREHPYDPAFVRAEDHELWLRVCGSTVFGRLQEPLFFYRESLSGNLRNYLRSSKTIRKIVRVYGPSTVGLWGTAALIFRAYLKSLKYSVYTAFGLQGRIIKKRVRCLDAAEVHAAGAALHTIMETNVPGLVPKQEFGNERNERNERRPVVLHVTTVPQTLYFLSGHVENLKSKGFDVHALSSPGQALERFGKQAQVEVHAVLMPRYITPLRDLASLWKIGRIMRRLRPDIVHGHTPKGGLLAMIGAWFCGVPVRVYHMHGLPLETAQGFRRLLLRWSEQVACLLAHQVFCVSPSLRALALAERLCAPDKIKFLLCGSIGGIDAERLYNPAGAGAKVRYDIREQYHIPADALVAGFVGRIVRDKGLIELTEAWKILREEFPNLHLLVVGPFEPQDPVPPDVELLLRSESRIHLVGRINDIKDMPRFYSAMDLLILPTYREGFGTVFLEAAAMELPVVGTRVTGCMDAVRDAETGTLVPSHDGRALADAVRAYLNDAELRRRHGRAGRERVLRDFRPEDMSVAIHEEYLRLLNDRGIKDSLLSQPAAQTRAEVS